jgi:hydroxymethylpyrimidine pyrophosphatase-like HAD family hydrolase
MIVAVDVDGTLYDGSTVDPLAIAALAAAVDGGHTILISTGRPWRDLPEVIPDVLPLVAAAVCEEGSVLVDVATGQRTFFADPVDQRVADRLVAAGVDPVVVGEVMISGPSSAIATFRALLPAGKRLVVNKDSVAVLPIGCDKGTGLRLAMTALGLDGRRLMAIGDAENDLPMFAIADVAVAVAGADAAVRAAGVTLTAAGWGAGVAEALRGALALDRTE